MYKNFCTHLYEFVKRIYDLRCLNESEENIISHRSTILVYIRSYLMFNGTFIILILSLENYDFNFDSTST